jgi:hypothetical protein
MKKNELEQEYSPWLPPVLHPTEKQPQFLHLQLAAVLL